MGEKVSSATVAEKATRIARPGYARYVFWIMFAVSFLNYLDRFVFTGAANVMAKELGLGLDDVGFISSAFLVVYTLSTVPLGLWADRTKRKNVVAVCVTFWSCVTSLTALAGNFTTLFLSRMVLGIGEAGYFPAGTALMSDYFNRSKRSRIMSWWGTAQLFGILGGYVLGGSLAGLYTGSWRLAFLFTGIPGLIVAFFIWRLREPRRNEAEEDALLAEPLPPGNALEGETLAIPPVADLPASAAKPGFSQIIRTLFADVATQFSSLLRIKTLVVLIAMQVFGFFALGVNTLFLPIYLQQKDLFGFSSSKAGLFSGVIIVLAGIIGTAGGGYMADALNRRHPGARVLVCGIGFLLSAPAFALAVTYHDIVIFTVFFIITAILITIYSGPSTAATQDVVPARLRASALALSLLIAHLLGDAFAPSLVGVLAKGFDPTHGQHFAQTMAGNDIGLALLVTCVPALVCAGLIGIFGARWMAADIRAAERADRLAMA